MSTASTQPNSSTSSWLLSSHLPEGDPENRYQAVFRSSNTPPLQLDANQISTSSIEHQLPFRLSPPVQSTTKTSACERRLTPHDLSLTVTLNKDSFVPEYEGTKRQDVQIDVFYNGKFTASSLVRAHDIWDPSQLFRSFSGVRTGRFSEHAWMIVPGEHENHQTNQTATRQERWKSIGNSLRREADLRGFDKHGDRSVVGEYLESLASYPMPPALSEVPYITSRSMGIIDVVLSLGQGKKSLPHLFCAGPEKLHDRRYRVDRCPERSLVEDTRTLASLTQEKTDSLPAITAPLHSALTEVDPSDSDRTKPKLQATSVLQENFHPPTSTGSASERKASLRSSFTISGMSLEKNARAIPGMSDSSEKRKGIGVTSENISTPNQEISIPGSRTSSHESCRYGTAYSDQLSSMPYEGLTKDLRSNAGLSSSAAGRRGQLASDGRSQVNSTIVPASVVSQDGTMNNSTFP